MGDIIKLDDHFNPSVLYQTVKTQMKCSIKLHVTIVSAPFDENTTRNDGECITKNRVNSQYPNADPTSELLGHMPD